LNRQDAKVERQDKTETELFLAILAFLGALALNSWATASWIPAFAGMTDLTHP
jgi:hypothetical protein